MLLGVLSGAPSQTALRSDSLALTTCAKCRSPIVWSAAEYPQIAHQDMNLEAGIARPCRTKSMKLDINPLKPLRHCILGRSLLLLRLGMSAHCLVCTDLWPRHSIAKSVLCSNLHCPGFVEALPNEYIISVRNEEYALFIPARQSMLASAAFVKTRRSQSCPQLNCHVASEHRKLRPHRWRTDVF